MASVAAQSRRRHARATVVLLAAMCGAAAVGVWGCQHYNYGWLTAGVPAVLMGCVWLLEWPYVLEPPGLSTQVGRAKQLDLAMLAQRLYAGAINGTERWLKPDALPRFSPIKLPSAPDAVLRQVVNRLEQYTVLQPPLWKLDLMLRLGALFMLAMYCSSVVGSNLITSGISLRLPFLSTAEMLAQQGWAIAVAALCYAALAWATYQRQQAKLALGLVCPYLAARFAGSGPDATASAGAVERVQPTRPAMTLCALDSYAGRAMTTWPMFSAGVLWSYFMLNSWRVQAILHTPVRPVNRPDFWGLMLVYAIPLVLYNLASLILARQNHAAYRRHIRQQLEASTLAEELANNNLSVADVENLVPAWLRLPVAYGWSKENNELAKVLLALSWNLDYYLARPQKPMRPVVLYGALMILCVVAIYLGLMFKFLTLPFVCTFGALGWVLLVLLALHHVRIALHLRELVDYLADRLLG